MTTLKIFFAMKNQHKSALILLILIFYSCGTQKKVSAQQEYVSTQVFYDQLGPYGEWIDNPNYGYVWIPNVDQGFSPYSTSGYWVMTDYGWTWVSDYPWGWAPFHYGRWDYNNYYGWFWVPDNEWGPSWVTWRSGNGYYGWTPMRPGVSINHSFGNDYHDIDHWYFVRERDFGRHDMHRYYADRRDYNTIIVNSTVINNTYIDRSRNTTYISGPSRNDVQRVTGRKISNVSVRDNERPGQQLKNDQMQIYRPQIKKTSDRDHQPAPTRITNQKDIRPERESNRPEQQGKSSTIENNTRDQKQSQPQRQIENQKQSQPAQQTEKRNQEQPQQQEQRRQGQQQLERQNQQKQQINKQVQEQVRQQKQRTQQQVEKQQQEKQRQVQQQQKQERSNQEKQVKQQNQQQPQQQQIKQQEPKPNRNSNERQRR